MKRVLAGVGLLLILAVILVNMWELQRLNSLSNTRRDTSNTQITESDVNQNVIDAIVQKVNQTLFQKIDKQNIETKGNHAQHREDFGDYEELRRPDARDIVRNIDKYKERKENRKTEVIIIQPEKEVARKREYEKKAPVVWFVNDDVSIVHIYLFHCCKI